MRRIVGSKWTLLKWLEQPGLTDDDIKKLQEYPQRAARFARGFCTTPNCSLAIKVSVAEFYRRCGKRRRYWTAGIHDTIRLFPPCIQMSTLSPRKRQRLDTDEDVEAILCRNQPSSRPSLFPWFSCTFIYNLITHIHQPRHLNISVCIWGFHAASLSSASVKGPDSSKRTTISRTGLTLFTLRQ